jgi:hypothetical protein
MPFARTNLQRSISCKTAGTRPPSLSLLLRLSETGGIMETIAKRLKAKESLKTCLFPRLIFYRSLGERKGLKNVPTRF